MTPRDALFRAAAEFHAAVAEHYRARRQGLDIEPTVQAVVGNALRYRMAIESLLPSEKERATRRLAALRASLHYTSQSYNIRKRLESRG